MRPPTQAVRVRPETHARLKALSEAQHTTMDWIITQLLNAKYVLPLPEGTKS